MKKRCIGTLVMLIMSLSFVTSAYAQANLERSVIASNSPFVVTQNYNVSRFAQIQPRGSVISTGILQISNRGNGNIGVYIQTLTHKEVDETTFGVYVDRWIESEKRWANVASYKFSYTKEDNPDDDLTIKSLSFDVVGQPVDCYYRLRGAHMVVLDGNREMLTSETDGILITNDKN